MRKNINKLATLVMTGALAASMSFGAFAAGTGDQTTTSSKVMGVDRAEKTITVTKKVVTDGHTFAPNTSFSFKVEPANITTEERKFNVKDGDITISNIKQGPEGSITEVSDAKFGPTVDTMTTVAKEYTAPFTVKFDEAAFKGEGLGAGVYKYKLTEVQTSKFSSNGTVYDNKNEFGQYPGMNYDETEYFMYAFVEYNGETPEVKNVVMVKAKNANNTYDNTSTVSTNKVNELVNYYGVDPEDPENPNKGEAHDLIITKEIKGNARVESDTFTLNIKVDADADDEHFEIQKYDGTDSEGKDKWVPVYKKDANGNDTTTVVELVDGEAQGVDVTQGTKYRIQGLTGGDLVSVKETGATEKGYEISHAVSDDIYLSDCTDSEKYNSEKNDAVVFVNSDGQVLTIINTRDQMTPTGVVMDVAPYALMVALAGGAAATFLRKKESFED